MTRRVWQTSDFKNSSMRAQAEAALRGENPSARQVAIALGRTLVGKAISPSRSNPAHRQGMNKSELAFAEHLTFRRIPYMFEAIKLRLGDRCYYTPDFFLPQGFMTGDNAAPCFIEVKAWWKSTGKPGWREDARVKFKAAAEQYPMFRWGASWWNPTKGEREYEWIGHELSRY